MCFITSVDTIYIVGVTVGFAGKKTSSPVCMVLPSDLKFTNLNYLNASPALTPATMVVPNESASNFSSKVIPCVLCHVRRSAKVCKHYHLPPYTLACTSCIYQFQP